MDHAGAPRGHDDPLDQPCKQFHLIAMLWDLWPCVVIVASFTLAVARPESIAWARLGVEARLAWTESR
jgi:hypothetical protein